MTGFRMPPNGSRAGIRCLVCGSGMVYAFSKGGYDYATCPACGLNSTCPIPNEEALERHYAKKFDSGNYRLLREFSEEYKSVYEGFVTALDRKLNGYGKDLRGQRILDVGCFTGEFLELLRDRGADVYGLELQAEAVEIASAKLPGRIFRAGVHGNEFPIMEYDVITMMGLIEHVVDPVEMLQRAANLLVAGGVLMLQTPNNGSLFARVMGKHWPPYAPVEHIHLFRAKSLRSVLSRLGFTDLTIRPHVKALPIAYVYGNMENFGSDLRRFLAPLYLLLPAWLTKRRLPFYIGEILVMARKAPGTAAR